MAGYRPGICNIGINEIRKRYAFGAIGLVLALLLAYLLFSSSSPRIYRLALFIPLFMAFEGFYQGYFGFCVGFATLGIYDFAGSGGGRGKANDEQHRTDMARAMAINIYSALSGLAVTLIVYFVS